MGEQLSFVVPLIAVVATFSAASAFAEQPMTVKGEPIYQERVSFADLDLNQRAHQRQLRVRVHAAADRVCIAAYGPNGAQGLAAISIAGQEMTCSEVAYATARPQITRAIDNAKSGHLAVAQMTLVASAR